MGEGVAGREPHFVNKARLEFLCDGIFAIAMTLLVLELKVPELVDRHSVPELAGALRRDLPGFVSYLLSFFVLGIFWTAHNQWYRHVQRVTKPVVVLQLVQLAVAAFFPFCAALVGRYATNPLSMVVYLGCATSYLWAGSLLWLLSRRSGALTTPSDPGLYPRIQRRLLVGSCAATLMFLIYLAEALMR